MRITGALFVLVAVAVAASGCSVEGLLPVGPTPPPVVISNLLDPTGDASGPAVVFDAAGMSTRRSGAPGVASYTDLLVGVEFANPSPELVLPPPGSHPASDGGELAWALCISTGGTPAYVINPSVPNLACDYLVDGGALTSGQGGAGRQADGRYRVVRVTSSSPLSVTDTGARADAIVVDRRLQVTVDIRPLNITSQVPTVAAVFAAGNRRGGVWNITDFVPDGAVGLRL